MPDIDWYTLKGCLTVANEFCNIVNFKLFQNINKPTIVCSCSLDTLFIDNNSPTQWSIKIKFVPLRNPSKTCTKAFQNRFIL